MSDTARAMTLLLSVLLWSPVAPGLLRGEISSEKALLLFAVALVLATSGCRLLAGLVQAYAPPETSSDGSAAHGEDGFPLGRRAEDLAA